MAVKSRGNVKIEISTDGGTTYNPLPQPTQLNYNGNLGTIDIRHFDSTAQEAIASIHAASADYSGYFVPGNAQLAALRSANEAGTKIKVKLTYGEAGNEEVFVFDAYVSDFKMDAGDAQNVSATLKGDGAVSSS